MNQTKQMNPLTIAKGKLTKLGVGLTAAGPIVQNILNVLQGEEMQPAIVEQVLDLRVGIEDAGDRVLGGFDQHR